jgi:uncharacterized RDD family membrane protein YckC
MNNKCVNHPDKNATSFCHKCKDYICEDCIIQGPEYNYCKKEECQLDYNNEVKVIEKDIEENIKNRASFLKRAIAIHIDFGILMVFNLSITKFMPNLSMMNLIMALNILFFLKDITGQSPGKKILGIKIVDKKTKVQTPPFQILIFRNLIKCLGIIELYVLATSKYNESLSDILTKTTVVNENK